MKRFLFLAAVLAFAGCDSGMTGSPDACVTTIAVICDGDDLTARDSCSGASTLVETCTGACYQGSCVACAPEAGRLCVGLEVHDVDSCGTVGGIVETCTDECRAGSCVGPECTAEASTVCVEDTLYTRDSCDNLENAIANCASGCTAGACTGCTPDMFSICFEGDIYSVDSCGVLGERTEDCPETCQLAGGAITCVTGLACTDNDQQTCFRGDLHYVDSCGSVQTDLYMDCESGCDQTGCLPCTPAPVGTTCSDGDVHDLVGGCGGAPTVGELVEDCAEGCNEGECVTGCIPGAGTVCSSGDVYLVDSCGAMGALSQDCTMGCEMGACTGGGGTDAGPPAGACTCTVSPPDSYPPVNCLIGDTQCTGCLGFDASCESDSCSTECRSEFTCVDGSVVLDGTVIVNCVESGSPLCSILSCGIPAG